MLGYIMLHGLPAVYRAWRGDIILQSIEQHGLVTLCECTEWWLPNMTPSLKGHEGCVLFIAFEAFNEPSKALYNGLEITLSSDTMCHPIELASLW